MTRIERQAESDDEVRSNIPPELVALFERVKRGIKASPRMSRTESFLILLPARLCACGRDGWAHRAGNPLRFQAARHITSASSSALATAWVSHTAGGDALAGDLASESSDLEDRVPALAGDEEPVAVGVVGDTVQHCVGVVGMRGLGSIRTIVVVSHVARISAADPFIEPLRRYRNQRI